MGVALGNVIFVFYQLFNFNIWRKKMKKIVCLFVCLFVGPTNAAINNGSFESGLTGWTTIGGVTTSSSHVTDGSFSARLNPGTSISTIEAGLGLTAGTIDSLTADGGNGSGKPTNGAAIFQDIDIVTNETISFDFFFDDNESNNNWNDTAIAILDEGVLLDFILGSSLSTDDNGGNANFTATQNFLDATLAFVVFNQGDQAVNPQLYIDNVQSSTTVSEPASIALLGVGLAFIGFSRKKTL